MGTFARSAMTTVYTKGVKPVIFKMHPDKVHDDMITHGSWAQRIRPAMAAAEALLKHDDPALVTEAYDLTLRNPLGLAAGLDKNVAIPGILQMTGFGLLTFGSVTSRVCDGNPRPWFHRLPQDESLVVHVGLANGGVERVATRLVELREQGNPRYMALPFKMSIARTNDGHTGDVAEGVDDYVRSVQALDGLSELIELNISCPNTMVGEAFTGPEALDQLLTAVDDAAPAQPIVLKMPSDKTWEQFRDLVDVALDHRVAGLTISNLRKDRDSVTMDPAIKGNLSGRPVRELSTEIVRRTYLHAGDRLTIAGLGGVFDGSHAYDKICAGATLVELVSGLIFRGPAVVGTIAKELVELAQADGFARVQDAVGSRADLPVATD
ncbi:dihydroorotate dehydrogenase (quinone) [Demequina capsici]|uniref:Dihydroorotate dehydrogenase (quinone) n=1 Tax=Demequina capsici TaxID=3075620 RepID=A0AA96J7Z5_9MICO|nr:MULTISPECIES: dihydroorotate dehydrogenase (quinone) [unclassified Demequina]WNM24885.1 dihydroorotate dehydrogenase (quinone) [Demequina sp. OYTSA14]WNM27791.1 dihydroorotate dehydrogenase (quinone) [Demequina sp. PMTSA13]